ncbi:MAG: biotin synthase BioB [Desulfobulbaceae bacterium]|nr:biotin synthase BioB [Desulfobulbaceae bacterium]
MHDLLTTTYDQLIHGEVLDRETALCLALSADPQALFSLADNVRRHFMGDHFHLCSIINARSGNCSEDCRFCAQSARHHTGVTSYEVVDTDEAMEQARDNDRHGIHRLSLVTSGRRLNDNGLGRMEDLYTAIKKETSFELCASMGLLDEQQMHRLAGMGVNRYHCNLETNKSFFPTVCTTHTYQDKVTTLRLAREQGMSLCSGGIIGMGETMEDRIDLAFELRDLEVQSIPINILTPIAGTPFADLEPLPVQEVLTTIALFRLINPDAIIRLAGGRQLLEDDQYRCFTSGANGALVGNYLTTVGNSVARDLQEVAALGYTFNR